MGNEACGAALLSISVCYALPGHVWLREIQPVSYTHLTLPTTPYV